MKLTASLSKKVPGAEDYSNQMAHAGIEIEIPDNTSADDVRAKLDGMYGVCSGAVDAQIGADPTDSFSSPPPSRKTEPEPQQQPAPQQQAPPSQNTALQVPVSDYEGTPPCPECGSDMWDNRDKDRGPAFKCKKATWDKRTKTAGGCPGCYWPDAMVPVQSNDLPF